MFKNDSLFILLRYSVGNEEHDGHLITFYLYIIIY